MGATLHFSTEQFFDGDLRRAEAYFGRIVRHIDPYEEVGKSLFYNPAIVDLLDCLRIVFDEKVYEIRKTNPRLVALPRDQQDLILADIRGLGMKYDYHNPKHYFIYEMQHIMLPQEPFRMWNGPGILAEKLEVNVGFYHPFTQMKLDAVTRKTLKKAEWHNLVLTFNV